MTSTTGILPQRVAMECARAVPSRPLRRMVVILLLWTCFCYLIFRYGTLHEQSEVVKDFTPNDVFSRG